MGLLIFLIICATAIYFISKNSKERSEIKQKKIDYVKEKWPNARIIVNIPNYLFFIDESQGIFRYDEGDKTYKLDNVLSAWTVCAKYNSRVSFYILRELEPEKRAFMVENFVHIVYCDRFEINSNKDMGRHLSEYHANEIINAMLPFVRNNLHRELLNYGITPTHEYEVDGIIWGCDINSKKFYSNYLALEVYDFSDFVSLNVQDLRDNTIIPEDYCINIYIKHNSDNLTYPHWQIYINGTNISYQGILSMFKGIKNRQ